MKTFKEYLNENKVKKGSLNPAEARSLFAQAHDRIEDVAHLPLTEKNASFRFEDAYEALREVIQAFMAQQGYKPYSHEAIIAFAKEEKLLSEREIITLDRYREIRNDINYQGERVTILEAQQIILFATKIINSLTEKMDGK